MSFKGSVWQYFDIWLLAAVLLLVAYGILMIRSAVTGAPDLENSPQLQLRWAVIGIILMFVVASVDYRYLTSAHWYIYFGFIGLLLLVAAVGSLNNQVNRWIPIGSFLFQPSEYGRILLAITFSQFLANRQNRINDFSNTLLSLVYIGGPVGLIFLQPDLGMSILFMVMWFIMIWLAGLPLTHFMILAGTSIVGGILVLPFLAEYQRLRLLVFFSPDAVPEDAFNTQQALISIGSGGFWGKGYMNGTQSQLGFLRVQHTDFIFSMITEEMGLIFGAAVVLGLMGFILLRMLRVASLTSDPVGRYICVGIAGVLFFQTAVSVGMNVQVVPVTGLTLPFVSYGGSSLTSLFLAIGVIQSVRMRHRKQDFG